jgi:serralysin
VINMSFGAGWTAANDWHGDYDKVGDLSADATYANAHTYPVAGQTTDATIQRLNADARLAAAGRPVVTTEIGWNTGGQGAAVAGVAQAVLDGIKNRDAGMYFYALFDDMSGKYGLMNADGSPRPAGATLHNLTTLLADHGGRFALTSLHYSLNGAVAGDNTLLMQKSDGSFWLALWDESAPSHRVTVTLEQPASRIAVFDPVSGTSPVPHHGDANQATVDLAGDPLLIEIMPATGAGKSDAAR